MRRDDIEALHGLDSNELIAKAAEFDIEVHPDDIGSIRWPSLDSIRLAIVQQMADGAVGDSALSKLGAEHFHEARKLHIHGMTIANEAEEAMKVPSKYELAHVLERRAHLHFEASRSAAALAQVGCTAAALESTAAVLKGLNV